jgi:hypothetical protein
MARPSDLGAELRYMKDLLRPLDEEVRQHQGQVRTFYVRDGCGGLRQEKVILKSAAVAVAQATVSPGSAALTRPRGDAALDVLLLVVMGHLRYVTGDHQLVRAAELVAQGLKIGVSGEMGGPAYAVEAMRQRAYRCRDQSSKTDHRERAGIVARTIALSIRLD